jgi:type IV pilus assembly PilX-like protein
MRESAMEERSFEGRRGEQGFALVLAILSLMLLTFLGLTMAATTSTELQIANNYRWSQQALYNAEAGLEAARYVLTEVADPGSEWSTRIPAARTTPWTPTTPTAPAWTDGQGRDYEHWECDDRGAGVGYGLVLADDALRYENISTFAGRALNGAFTIWVRRALSADTNGYYTDLADNDKLVVVAEGVAPYVGTGVVGQMDVLVRSRQAVRVLETRYKLGSSTAGAPCGLNSGGGQAGMGATGDNYTRCVNITAGAGGTLGPVFGGTADSGSLGSFSDVQ